MHKLGGLVGGVPASIRKGPAFEPVIYPQGHADRRVLFDQRAIVPRSPYQAPCYLVVQQLLIFGFGTRLTGIDDLG